MGETVVTKWYESETTQSEHEMVRHMQLHVVVVKRYSGILFAIFTSQVINQVYL